MANKILFAILSILVVSLVVLFGVNIFIPINLTGFFSLSESEIASNLQNLYGLVNPGVSVAVEKLEEVSGIYKTLLRVTDASGEVGFREVYITKDGELLAENVILVDSSIEQIKRIYGFTDCLHGKGVKIFGVSNHTETLLQLNLLGGLHAAKMFISCDGDLAQQCISLNVTYVPTVVYENTGYPGVQSIQSLGNLTSCKY